jgi:hypothetical protein
LTLFVTPVFYTFMDRLRRKPKLEPARETGTNEDTEQAAASA